MRIPGSGRGRGQRSRSLPPTPATGRGRPDLRLGAGQRNVRPGGVLTDRVVARHTVQTSIAEYTLVLNGIGATGWREVGNALRDAVAELRAIDLTYSPVRPASLVSRLRRGEISADAYPPLADIVARCAAMRAATDGWFDAWAVPGGFDPGGLLVGWAVERAAARLRAAGIEDYAVISGADLTVRGHAPHGGPWRIAVHHPTRADRQPTMLEMTSGAIGTSGVAGRRDHVVDPHTGQPADKLVAATVIGPDLSIADGYATALFAAGRPGLAWFPTPDGYEAL
ncbi:FAD:protein FMN transferase [Plantactinospora sp. WMMB334]|uniref:FAD:protein FMN transferase n=1 Tax=Plantactinospora sp. WMMB334 TaxID=3404119 RepID=UPI003B9667D7